MLFAPFDWIYQFIRDLLWDMKQDWVQVTTDRKREWL
jgi:hypothetical protein